MDEAQKKREANEPNPEVLSPEMIAEQGDTTSPEDDTTAQGVKDLRGTKDRDTGKATILKMNISRKELWRGILAVAIIIVGITHFAKPEPYVKIMPPYLPYHLELVYISGFFEILGGIGLLIPPVSRAAAWGLIALFIAVFPANINLAVNNIPLEGIPHNPILNWVRLPFQAVLIAWAWWFTKEEPQQPQEAKLTD